MSPPRGGFRPDDPNQQIVAEDAEDIFDEYGGKLTLKHNFTLTTASYQLTMNYIQINLK